MSIWGKILGGTAGFVFGGPLGALVGVAGGHFMDRHLAGKEAAGVDQRGAAFSLAVIALSAKLAKVDGQVTRAEIRSFKQIFRYAPEDHDTVARVYREAQQSSEGYQTYARQVTEIFGRGSVVLEELLWSLAEIAKADGHFHAREVGFLREVAQIFGLRPEVFARINALEEQGNAADPYVILGVDSSIDDQALKSHYRGLVRKLHPDRLTAEGMPTEVIEVSGRKLAAINEAYDRVCQARGMR